MPNLLDAIRGNSQPQKAGVTDETQKLQTLLRAKSGKAISSGPTLSSNLQESQAVDQTNAQLGQVAAQAGLQQQGLQQQQQQAQQSEQLQSAEIAQGRQFDTMQTRLKTDALLSEFERNKGQLDLNRERANVEQLGTGIRLSDKQYTDNLQREGQKSRLDDEITFKEELLRTQLGDQQEIMEKNLGNKGILEANDREFQKSLAQMGIDDAWSMFRAQQRADQQKAMWTGIGSIATAGIGAAGKMGAGGAVESEVPGSSASDYTSLPDGDGTSAADYTSLK